jgi:glyoxylase-like metal-dependent hydrolase (beta-lactamase superfamily II)
LKVTIGNLQVVAINDLNGSFPRANVFPNTPSESWPAYDALYPAAAAGDDIALAIASYVITGAGRTILVDTGLGPNVAVDRPGNLVPNLRAAGFQPADIDTVVFTHLHGDHVGWNFQDGVETFANARYVVQQADWDHFGAMTEGTSAVQVVPLAKTGRLQCVDGETQLTDEVTLLPTPGHTPGHQSVIISSAGARGFIGGDISHHPAQVEETGWVDFFDMDKPVAAATRARVFEQLERDGSTVAFGHFPFPGMGLLVREDGRRIFRAL